MWWIIITILLAIAFAVAIVLRRWKEPVVTRQVSTVVRQSTNVEAPAVTYHQPFKQGATIGGGVIVVLWLIATFFSSIRTVNAGSVGVVRQFGSIVGQTNEGIAFIMPWQNMNEVSIRTERHTFGSTEDPITAASSETQDVFVIVTINYSVSEANVQGLIRQYGTNWFDVLVPTRVNQYIKQETAKWQTIEIIPNREAIRQAILARLQADLSDKGITISDLLIDNISFSPEYTQAIEAKQVAIENAAAASNRVEITRAEAETARVQAQGRADSVEIAAQGQANANDLINASLTPELIQWQAVQRLSDNVQIALIPSGQGLIIDPATMLATDTTVAE